MKPAPALALSLLSVCSACGGDDASLVNAFTGTATITSAIPTGTAACLTTETVTITAAGVSTHTVSVAGGGCIKFTNSDTVAHQPASLPLAGCTDLNAPSQIAAGTSFTTAPLTGPKSCNWQDLLNPPPGANNGGGGGGGGGSGY